MGRVLFSGDHLPLFVSSVSPALFLFLSTRAELLLRLSKGVTGHPLYLPLFCLAIAAVFWLVVAASGHANSGALAGLTAAGWLFAVEDGRLSMTHWNYWALFDFSRVRWNAMSPIVADIGLLVVLGALSLSIFAPATALSLGVSSYDMDREFLGHSVSNLLAGVAGTVPNLLVCTPCMVWENDLTQLPITRSFPILDSSSSLAGIETRQCLLLSLLPSSFSDPPLCSHTCQRYWRQPWCSIWDSNLYLKPCGCRANRWFGGTGSQCSVQCFRVISWASLSE